MGEGPVIAAAASVPIPGWHKPPQAPQTAIPQPQEPQQPQDPQPTQEPEKPFANALAQWRLRQGQSEKLMMESYRLSLGSDPTFSARMGQLAKERGIDPSILHTLEPTKVKELLAMRDFRARELAKTSPILARQLRDPQFARIAHDDLDNLSGTERWFTELGRNFQSGQAQSERGFLADLWQQNPKSEKIPRDLARVQRRLRSLPPESTGIFTGIFRTAGQTSAMGHIIAEGAVAGSFFGGLWGASGGPLAPVSVPAGIALGAGAGAISGIALAAGRVEGGNTFVDMLDLGYDWNVASDVATSVKIVNGLMEVGGLAALSAPIRGMLKRRLTEAITKAIVQPTVRRGLANAGIDFLKATSGEMSVEISQEVTNMVGEAIAREQTLSIDSSALTLVGFDEQFLPTAGDPARALPAMTGDEIQERLASIITQTFYGTALLGGFSSGVAYWGDRHRALQAQKNFDAVKALAKFYQDSQVAEIDPDAHADFVEEASEGSPTLYFQGGDVLAALQKSGTTLDQFEADFPGMLAKLQESQATGDLLAISASDFEKISRSSFTEALLPHVRVDEDGTSFAQAQERAKSEGKFEAEFLKIAEQSALIREESRVIEQDIRQQLLAAGRKTEVAASDALAYRHMITVLGNKIGLTPKEFQAAHGMRVVPGSEADFDSQGKPAAFRESDRTAFLFENQGPTSFLHETFHSFLSLYEKILVSPLTEGDRATEVGRQQLHGEFQTMLGLVSVKDLAEWQALSPEQKREHHEALALSWERWWAEGTAPSSGLSKLFLRMLRWITDFYEDVSTSLNAIHQSNFGKNLPSLTDDVRAVFGGMLAASKEVERSMAAQGLEAVFDQKPEGMSASVWTGLQKLNGDRSDEALERLSRDGVRAVGWVRRTTKEVDKHLRKAEKGLRAPIREQVQQHREVEPVYRALRFLRTGELLDEDGIALPADELFETPTHKLRTAAVKTVLGDVDLRTVLKGLTHPDGLTPDQVALMFDFRSGEELLDAVMNARPLAEVVEEETNARMLQEHPDFSDPKRRQALVDRAIHNGAQARFTAAWYRWMSGTQQPVRELIRAARNVAERRVGEITVGNLRPRQFVIAAGRAAREARRRASAGEFAEATIALRQQLLQEQLAQEAARVEEEVAKARKAFGKFNQSDTKLAKKQDMNLVQVARSVLSAYGIGSPMESAEVHLNVLKTYDPVTYEALRGMVEDLTKGARDAETLTVSEFLSMSEKVLGLWKMSTMNEKYDQGDAQVDRSLVRKELMEALTEFGIPKRGGDLEKRSDSEKRSIRLSSLKAHLAHVESWATKVDGGKIGRVHKYLFQRIRKHFDDYMEEKILTMNALHEQVIQHNMTGQRVAMDPETEFNWAFTSKDDLIGFILQMGSESNSRKNLVGRGWATETKEAGVDESKVWAGINRLIKEGKLTEADLDLAQYVWDIYDAFKGRAQKANIDNYGFPFKEIEARPFTVTFPNGKTKDYAGGYVPAKPDKEHSSYEPPKESATEDGLTTAAKQWQEGRWASTGKGFTIERDKSTRALEMSVLRQVLNIDAELRFIHLQRAGRDIQSMLMHPEIRGALEAIQPGVIQDMFLPWLDDSLQNRMIAPGGDPTVRAILTGLRRSASTIFMFANLPNAAQQITGLGVLPTLVPFGTAASAAMQYVGNHSAMAQAAFDKSKFMRLRIKMQMGAIMDEEMNLKFDPSILGTVQAWTDKNKFFLQHLVQNPVDIISWHAGYNDAIARGKTESEAVVNADFVVRQAQSSGLAVDVSRLERGSPLVRILTLFNSFWMKALNTVMLQPSASKKVQATAFLLGFAGLMGGAISQIFRGGWGDDDGDGAVMDDMGKWAFGEVTQTASAIFVPIVGPMVMRALFSQRSLGRLDPGATMSAAGSAVKGLRALATVPFDAERDLRGTDIKDVGSLLTFLLRVPAYAASRPASYGFDVARGNIEPRSLLGLPPAVDLGRGLLTGSSPLVTRR